jgi:hypothetical protein
MKIAWGATRFVILTDRFAIKFARFRPFRMLAQLYRRLRAGTVDAGLSQFHENRVLAAIKYMVSGVLSNLVEARFSRECPEETDVAPTLYSFLGLINIQPRGGAITDEDIAHCPFRDLASERGAEREFADLSQAKQFARFGSRILLVDMGMPEVARCLRARHKKPRLAMAGAATA